MSNKYLDNVYGETEEIYNLARTLGDCAAAFYRTGNESMGDTLSAISERLLDAQKNINRAVAEEFSLRVQ